MEWATAIAAIANVASAWAGWYFGAKRQKELGRQKFEAERQKLKTAMQANDIETIRKMFGG